MSAAEPEVVPRQEQPLSRESKQGLVDSVAFWWHSIDLGDGVVTPGRKSPQILEAEWEALALPNLEGRTVLDVGAWDGWFSFAAERAGAARVFALDRFVWAQPPGHISYGEEVDRPGTAVRRLPERWDPEGLPGRAGFDIARRALGSRVEPVVSGFPGEAAPDLGSFDVVLLLGVLYHLPDPFLALRRVADVTRELCVIESEGILVPRHRDEPMFGFYPANELNEDPTNWWSPNEAGLVALCRASGFDDVVVTRGEPDEDPPDGGSARVRLTAQAWKR